MPALPITISSAFLPTASAIMVLNTQPVAITLSQFARCAAGTLSKPTS